MNIFATILLAAPSVGEAFFAGAQKLIQPAIEKCSVIIPLMLFMHLLIVLTKTYLGNMQLDPAPLLKVIVLWVILMGYEQLAYAVFDATLYMNGMFGDSQNDILESLNKLSENAYLKKHQMKVKFTDVKIPFDDPTSFFTWLVMAVENGLSMIIRIFIERIRGVVIAFLLACGPIAITLSTVPGFGGTLQHWLRIFISTSFWSLTLAILDKIMIEAIPLFPGPEAAGFEQASQVLNLLVINGAVVLMYLSVPLLTSFYIGASASAAFLQAAQGAASAATAGAVSVAGKMRDRMKDKDNDKKKRQEDEKKKKEEESKSGQIVG